MQFKLQKDFPYLKQFEKQFNTTEATVFVFDNTIYTNYMMPPDIIVHELEHIRQQNKMGAEKWIQYYLANPAFRLEQEVKAYRVQLASVKNREDRHKIRLDSAKHLASDLYGGIVTFQQALNVLI